MKTQESLFGLGPNGKPLDVPDPPKTLPQRARGLLVKIAYACTYMQAREGKTAFQCPHRLCSLWPHRTGRWPEAESGKGSANEMYRVLCRVTGKDNGNLMLRCYAMEKKQRCKLPNVGWIGSALSGVGGVVATDLKKPVSVTVCTVCGKEIVGRRKTLRYCSSRCRVRAHRDRTDE